LGEEGGPDAPDSAFVEDQFAFGKVLRQGGWRAGVKLKIEAEHRRERHVPRNVCLALNDAVLSD
jgi:hypothetical protein